MKKLSTLLLITIGSILFSGCATQMSAQAQKIIETDQSQIKNCKSLGEVSGYSSYGGLVMQETGKQYAKNEALNQAADRNATHVVWAFATGSFTGGRAQGQAYNCNR